MSGKLGGQNMSHKTKIIVAALMGVFLSSTAFASDVYLDQAGSNTNINITQTGTANIVNDASTSATVSGDTINIDVVQNGSNNEAFMQVTGSSTTIDYNAQGSTNFLDISINGGTGNTLTVLKEGDDNRVTFCGTNDGAAGNGSTVAGSNASCTAGVTVNDTVNTVNIYGDRNSVNIAAASANAQNSITIGTALAATSNDNIVNINQTNVDSNIVNLTIDGSTNVVNIIQN